jgi:hypothetical protein
VGVVAHALARVLPDQHRSAKPNYPTTVNDTDRGLERFLAASVAVIVAVAALDSFPYDTKLDPVVSDVTRSWTPGGSGLEHRYFRATPQAETGAGRPRAASALHQ